VCITQGTSVVLQQRCVHMFAFTATYLATSYTPHCLLWLKAGTLQGQPGQLQCGCQLSTGQRGKEDTHTVCLNYSAACASIS
jgi:hypothetical protein